jgi:tRNA pseudouridine38-40 synthase
LSSPIAHYKAILAYDGTNFSGFQRQAKARTVQGEIEAALRQLGWVQRTILAAGRTDSGVHATGQVIAFALGWAHTPGDLLNALNVRLPEDIAIQQMEVAEDDFHPRFDALSRRYWYTIFCSPVRDPLRERYAWRVWPEVDPDLLKQTAAPFLGDHDFQAFGTPPHPGGRTMRSVFVSEWKQVLGSGFVFEIESKAFLFHMVRRIVQLQVDVARNRLPFNRIVSHLSGELPDPVMGLAPPHGLNLLLVRYPK